MDIYIFIYIHIYKSFVITHTGILRLTSTVSNDSLGLDTWSRIVNPASVCILPRTVSGSIQNVKSNSIEIKNSTFKKDYTRQIAS